MSQTKLAEDGRYRLVRYETPFPPVYEVWSGDTIVFTSYWRSSATRKYKQLMSQVSVERGHALDRGRVD